MNFDPDLLDKLRNSRHLAVFTGAGVSAESGIPTFRDALAGLWAKYRPEDLATPEAFLRDPAMVWQWYASRRAAIAAIHPNPGHHAIARLGQLLRRLTVITQNVDGLHQAAGSGRVLELHGNIHRNTCFACGREATPEEAAQDATPPLCQGCGGMLRPGVVWFGEALPAEAWRQSVEAVEDADLFFCVGTSSLVEPAASLPRLARSLGCAVVQINPDATAHDAVADFILRGKSGEVLPRLLDAAFPAA
ncbi:SIR2 family NAD-dependent protein deacylase [Noviherbaspirillum aridicola]|uniref:NAD-dependent protein deacylase n=1 Tax=Noviherbaspirillum aridicola TaxID=2849687 RepID=A0ABQ4Q132_9BURK|nr:NAD-dependent deacylase [Noviherbaspirillum aridicola]GIZ50896.1 NAD-dependent protein deacylase [Noviherbaspirillum aridicola]